MHLIWVQMKHIKADLYLLTSAVARRALPLNQALIKRNKIFKEVRVIP